MAQLAGGRQRVDDPKRDTHSLDKYQNNSRTLANVEHGQQILARLEAGNQANSQAAQSSREVPLTEANQPKVAPQTTEEVP